MRATAKSRILRFLGFAQKLVTAIARHAYSYLWALGAGYWPLGAGAGAPCHLSADAKLGNSLGELRKVEGRSNEGRREVEGRSQEDSG
jgi:hypothetical protein